jgi:dTDP-L-rhamnose 4-epimerase
MRVLITGGAGFIGSHVVDALLARGDKVRVLDSLDAQVHDGIPHWLNPDAELVQGDIRDAHTVRRCLAGVEGLVHLAAAVGVGQSMYEIERYTSVNAIGAAVVLEEALAVRDRLEKMIVASSMSIYGEGAYRCVREDREVLVHLRHADRLEAHEWEPRCPSCGASLEPIPTPETKPLQPGSIYAINKRDHEEMFLVCGSAYRIPTTALRFFNVYGPRQALSNPYTGVAAIFASRLLNDRAPVIFEDGNQSRDFVHVSDIATGVVLALEPGRGDGHALNLGTGTATTVRQVAAVLANELGVAVEPEIRNDFRAGDIRHCIADIECARRELGYEPEVCFADGMRELSGWLAEQTAEDHVAEATADLVRRGLTR